MGYCPALQWIFWKYTECHTLFTVSKVKWQHSKSALTLQVGSDKCNPIKMESCIINTVTTLEGTSEHLVGQELKWGAAQGEYKAYCKT